MRLFYYTARKFYPRSETHASVPLKSPMSIEHFQNNKLVFSGKNEKTSSTLDVEKLFLRDIGSGISVKNTYTIAYLCKSLWRVDLLSHTVPMYVSR